MGISNKKPILNVEGDNDFYVISNLCEKHGLPHSFEIQTPTQRQRVAPERKQKSEGMQRADSWQTLLNKWEMELKGDLADVPAIGVVIDADDDPVARWRALGSVVQKAQLSYVWPSKPELGGTILPAPNEYTPRLGVWLMPNNQVAGELEDFVSWLIPTGDELAPLVHKILDEIELAGLKKYKKRTKAFVHTWLAWQKRPLPMGQAITENVLTADSPPAQQFVTWLNRLFNE